MVPYGFVITDAGRALIAGWTAGEISSSLAIAEIMVGSGSVPNDWTLENIYGMKDLIAPFAKATSTVPAYDGSTVRMTIEYRSDMNGGLQTGTWLSEFGIFVEHPTDAGAKIMFAYGTLGDRPQYVSAYGAGLLDIRRFPVSITIGAGVEVEVLYDTTAFMTSDEVAQYFSITIMPQLIEQLDNRIAVHNADVLSHPDIRALIAQLEGRIGQLEEMFVNDVKGTQFMVTFSTLDNAVVTGTWNKAFERVEF